MTERWVVCINCDIVQPVIKSWVCDGGWELTECQFCERNDVPYQIDLIGCEIDDVTELEREIYRKKKDEQGINND